MLVEPMTRFLLISFVAVSALLATAVPSRASNAWRQERELSKQYAVNGEWKRACRYAVLAGSEMAKAKSLSVDYMAKIGKRCTEAAR